YVFTNAKLMCLIFMGLTMALSLLRPVLAFIWGRYIDSANDMLSVETILPTIGFAVSYAVLKFIIDLLVRYTSRREDIERLDVVQANRFQENIDSEMYKQISQLSPEYMEIPKINDTMKRVFDFTADGWSGLNVSIMTPGYWIIAKTVSVVSIGLA